VSKEKKYGVGVKTSRMAVVHWIFPAGEFLPQYSRHRIPVSACPCFGIADYILVAAQTFVHVPSHWPVQALPQPSEQPQQPPSQVFVQVPLQEPPQATVQLPSQLPVQPPMQPSAHVASARAGWGTVETNPKTAKAGMTLLPALRNPRRSIFSGCRCASFPVSGFLFI
jgi:hypothetical protein